MTSPRLPVPPMAWDRWGDPARAVALTPAPLAMVNDLLKVSAADVDAVPREEVRLRPSALDPADEAALGAIVGAGNVSTLDADRLPRAGGKSTLDLLRRKHRSEQAAPDAVVVPGGEDELAAVLALCAERGIAVVPFGG